MSPWLDVRSFALGLTGFERPRIWIIRNKNPIGNFIDLRVKSSRNALLCCLSARRDLKSISSTRKELQHASPRLQGRFQLCGRIVLIPQLYPIIRLPIFIVVAFSLTFWIWH